MKEDKFVYRSAKHAANLNNMRLNNKWSDVTIRVNNKEFPAHKVVLAANLKYFDTMLSSDSFRESKDGVVTMDCVEEADLEALVTYAYTGEILLTDTNALDLLELANYLGEDDIKDACIEFLERHLKAEQAWRAYKFADTIDCRSLKKIAKNTILSNIETCSQIPDFFNFDYEQLMDVLSDGKVQPVEVQQKLFEGTMRWIMHDVENRRTRTIDLLSFIDLKKVAADCLINYLCSIVVDRNDEYGIIKDVMFCYHNDINQEISSQTFPAAELLVIGLKGGALNYQFCNLTKKKWSPLQEIPYFHDKVFSTVAIWNNELYYISENSQGKYLSVFNPITKRNTVLQSSSSIFRYATLYACDGFLYMCGGFINHESRSDQVLKYDPRTNLFETLTPMRSRRSRAAVIYYEGFLHVLGGYDRTTRLNTVEKYNSDTKQWAVFPSMYELRSGHAVAVMDGKLYACGGFEKNSVEVYDPSKNSWQLIARMNKVRLGFIIVAHEGKLLAIGGDDEGTVEVYDPSKDEWQIDEELSSGLEITNPQGGLIPSNCFSSEP